MTLCPSFPNLQINAADQDDPPQIVQLLTPYVSRKIVLARDEADIRSYLGNFLVARQTDGSLAACVALRDFGDGLQEIRSLVVAEHICGQGLGTAMIQAALDKARQRRATRVLVLTLRPNLFLRLGFNIVDKEQFPQKVWQDCRLCPKFHACDETALLLTLPADSAL